MTTIKITGSELREIAEQETTEGAKLFGDFLAAQRRTNAARTAYRALLAAEKARDPMGSRVPPLPVRERPDRRQPRSA